ncbi:hypothetical protein ACQ4M3_27965 [Leptolyngbya sp. AN03gr2]
MTSLDADWNGIHFVYDVLPTGEVLIQPTDARMLTHFAELQDPRDKRGKE